MANLTSLFIHQLGSSSAVFALDIHRRSLESEEPPVSSRTDPTVATSRRVWRPSSWSDVVGLPRLLGSRYPLNYDVHRPVDEIDHDVRAPVTAVGTARMPSR